jgi:hypothetical protein
MSLSSLRNRNVIIALCATIGVIAFAVGTRGANAADKAAAASPAPPPALAASFSVLRTAAPANGVPVDLEHVAARFPGMNAAQGRLATVDAGTGNSVWMLPGSDTTCVVVVYGAEPGSSAACYPTAQVRTTGAQLQLAGANGMTTALGVVPDSVTAMHLVEASSGASTTVPVTNNGYVTQAHAGDEISATPLAGAASRLVGPRGT